MVHMAGRTYERRPSGKEDEVVLELRTSPYEVLRFRMGRRSRRQMAAMAWSLDPEPLLDSLAVFGPSKLDIIE